MAKEVVLILFDPTSLYLKKLAAPITSTFLQEEELVRRYGARNSQLSF